MDGLISEANEVAGEVDDNSMQLSSAARRQSKHYEISRYGTLIAWAEELGYDNVTGLLKSNLREEKAADRKLSALAEAKVNRKATGIAQLPFGAEGRGSARTGPRSSRHIKK